VINTLVGIKLFQKRLLKTLITTTIGITGILTFLIWLVQSLRFGRMISYQGLGWKGLAQLCLAVLPQILSMSIPIGFILAVILVYSRMIQDNERNVMSACGVSPWFFAYPAFLFSLFLTGCLYALSLYFTPITIGLSKEKEYMMRYHFDPSFITPGVFFQIDGRMLYVHLQKERTLFEGIFLYDGRSPEKEEILTGQSADILAKGSGLVICIYQGTYQKIFSGKPPSLVHFKKYTLHLKPEDMPQRHLHVHELPLKKLFHPLNSDIKKEYQKELRQRFLMPFLPIVDVVGVTLVLLSWTGVIAPAVFCLVGVALFHMASITWAYGGFLILLGAVVGWVLWVFFLYRKRI
jgi:lipopolysaccharide export system permease protein